MTELSSQAEQTLWNLEYHKPTNPETLVEMDRVREAFKTLLVEIDSRVPGGRDKARCYTFLEDSQQCAIAALAREEGA